jgi:biopolymer transport protein ExbB
MQFKLRFAALAQGPTPKAAELVSVSNSDESGTPPPKPGFFKEHFGIFADISKSLTVDGWAVIILCSILAVIGAFVALTKLLYLNRIDKASRLFTSRWDSLAADITALERSPDASGPFSTRELTLVRQSPLFHIYHLGAHEITQRIDAAHGRFPGLSARSIEAIKARLDGGLVDEEERLNSRLVFLTLSIAGGPYLGLLGTVIGVMITFAVIAKSGEVEVNSIAPGIAGALLATVAGLAVAIPALFSYSYLNARITSALNGIRRFIDEFITRIAEAYPTADDS